MSMQARYRQTVYRTGARIAVKFFVAVTTIISMSLLPLGCSSDKGTSENIVHEAIAITTPQQSQSVSQTVRATAKISGGTADSVSFFVDQSDQPLATMTSQPYSFDWNLASYQDSTTHGLWAEANFTSGAKVLSDTVYVLVDNHLARPAAVTLEQTSKVTTETVTLKWGRSTDSDFESYRIYVSDDPGVDDQSELAATIDSQGRDTLTFNHGGEGVSRYYRVYVYDSYGLFSGSNEVEATTINLIPAPVQVSATSDVETGAITLHWNMSLITDFDRYEVRRADHADVSHSDELLTILSSEADTFYVDASVSPFSRYYYRVYVFDSGDLSAGGNEVAEELPTVANLEAEWNFDDIDGMTAFDHSGTGHNVTLFRGPARVDGVVGMGLELGVNNCYASFPPLYYLSPEALSVSIWVKLEDDSSGCVIYHGNNGEWAIYLTDGNTWSFRVRLTNAIWYTLDVPMAESGNWHHLAMVWQQGASLTGFIDGESVGEIELPDMRLFDPPEVYYPTLGAAGCSACGREAFIVCSIDEARVYTRALSDAEIRLLASQI